MARWPSVSAPIEAAASSLQSWTAVAGSPVVTPVFLFAVAVVSSVSLAQLLSLCGCVAFWQVSHLEGSVSAELRRRRRETEEREEKEKRPSKSKVHLEPLRLVLLI